MLCFEIKKIGAKYFFLYKKRKFYLGLILKKKKFDYLTSVF
jgi:hypothetical protein